MLNIIYMSVIKLIMLHCSLVLEEDIVSLILYKYFAISIITCAFRHTHILSQNVFVLDFYSYNHSMCEVDCFCTFNISIIADDTDEENTSSDTEDSKLPMQLAIVGRPNVGKSTLLNAILQEDRVLVGPEAGLTRDSIRVEFEYEGRTIYLVSFVRISTCYNFTFHFHKLSYGL